MNIKDHGKWIKYIPDPIPEKAPANAIFAKRESDNQDWYLYVHAVQVEVSPHTMGTVTPYNFENFDEASVKFVATYQEVYGAHIIGAAVYDPTMLFPAGGVLAEIFGYTGTDPQADFGNKVYDPVAFTITEAPTLPPPPLSDVVDPRLMAIIEDIMARLAALELKG
jgi:hypothetical protein